MKNLFRKSALEKLSSPEQLDKTIVITSPLSWLAIIGIFIIILIFALWSIFGILPTTLSSNGIIVNGKDLINVRSLCSGTIERYYTEVGDTIFEGDNIADIISDGGETITLTSTQSGVVSRLICETGENIEKYDTVLRLSSVAENNVLVCYLSADEGKEISIGMEAIVTPSYADTQKAGHMTAKVISTDDYLTSSDEIKDVLGNNDELLSMLDADTAKTAVVLELTEDDNTASGYYWSSENGADIEISDGTICTVQFIIDESAPITKLFPMFDKAAEE